MKPLDLGPGIPAPYELVDDGTTYSIATHYTLDAIDDQGCETLTTVDGSANGTTPGSDPLHSASVFLNAADPMNPFVRGDTAVFSFIANYDVHAVTVYSGPSNTCTNDTINTDLPVQSGALTCKPSGVTADLGGGFYGTYQSSDKSYKFTCSTNGAQTPMGVPATLSVSGQVFLTNP
jgi:hypothetical protein